MTVIDVSESDFQQEVIERSRTTPVVVDFWAAWCGPCRQLTPVLEKAASAREGDVVLAKLDTDANQQIAAQYGIQGIPAVKAFKDGAIVDEFVGAQPPVVVERFFDKLVPSEADALVAAGDDDSLRRALELEPGRAEAAVAAPRRRGGGPGRGRAGAAAPRATKLLRGGDADAASEILDKVHGSFAADGLKARIRLEQDDDAPPQARDAFAALDRGETEQAIDLLIEAIPASDGHREDLRQAVVAILDELGVEHPLARDARRRLATALY